MLLTTLWLCFFIYIIKGQWFSMWFHWLLKRFGWVPKCTRGDSEQPTESATECAGCRCLPLGLQSGEPASLCNCSLPASGSFGSESLSAGWPQSQTRCQDYREREKVLAKIQCPQPLRSRGTATPTTAAYPLRPPSAQRQNEDTKQD